MKDGMLWNDASDKSVVDVIAEAARYYERTRGVTPNVCRVHPSVESVKVPGIRVVYWATVLRCHYWIGVEEHDPVSDEVGG